MSSSKKELVQLSSYSRRLRDNVKSILDNYGEILRTSKVCTSLEALATTGDQGSKLMFTFSMLCVFISFVDNREPKNY